MKKRSVKILAIISALVIIIAAVTLTACNKEKDLSPAFEQERIYSIDFDNLNFMGNKGVMVTAVKNLAIDTDNTYFSFKPDGTMHGQIQTKKGLFGDIPALIDQVNEMGFNINLESMLSNVDLTQGLDFYAEPMFPGFSAKIAEGDLDGALSLLTQSIGFGLEGLDTSNDDIKQLIESMAASYRDTGRLKLPATILDAMPDDAVLTLTMDWKYVIKRVTRQDGSTYDAIYIGDQVATNPNTQPFAIFTLGEDKDGVGTATLKVEFMKIELPLKLNK